MRETAIFAGGCFWGVQYYYDQVPGVLETTAGYTGGHKENPTYEEVCSHTTGHAEAVKIIYDSSVVSYETLLKHFFMIHDPTTADRQGLDVGNNYRPAIFYTNGDQKNITESYIAELTEGKMYKKPIVTEVTPAGEFWDAEEYHQRFAERTGRGMCHVAYSPIE